MQCAGESTDKEKTVALNGIQKLTELQVEYVHSNVKVYKHYIHGKLKVILLRSCLIELAF